ncbi:unnamed protein product [Sphenostylis stenocarpa]|uniref:Uncharacterized protein n=1 Tax=Sphenostylis stenocarpa TaxID=92480 RepID=A0AA86S916_9FABA|nr:unnamed protein product [Sphenostylis stenocarpa]
MAYPTYVRSYLPINSLPFYDDDSHTNLVLEMRYIDVLLRNERAKLLFGKRSRGIENACFCYFLSSAD